MSDGSRNYSRKNSSESCRHLVCFQRIVEGVIEPCEEPLLITTSQAPLKVTVYSFMPIYFHYISCQSTFPSLITWQLKPSLYYLERVRCNGTQYPCPRRDNERANHRFIFDSLLQRPQRRKEYRTAKPSFNQVHCQTFIERLESSILGKIGCNFYKVGYEVIGEVQGFGWEHKCDLNVFERLQNCCDSDACDIPRHSILAIHYFNYDIQCRIIKLYLKVYISRQSLSRLDDIRNINSNRKIQMLITSQYQNKAGYPDKKQPKPKCHNVKEEFVNQFLDGSGNVKPEFRKISYADGSEYIGQFQDARHGKGLYRFANKDVFMGFWKEDKFHGDGIYLYGNGERYQGKFVDGKKHGRGVYYYDSGATYDGEWQKDRKNGFGIYSYANAEKYEGNWLNGEKHGKGTYFYKNGDKYIGEWVKNKKNGNGVLQYASGAVYDGEWIDDKACNNGEIIYANKDKYEGQFLSGKKHGKGIYHYNSGGKYKGEWSNDKKHGYGVIEYGNGDRYEGNWRNGERSGQGVYQYSNGDIYEGEWVADFKEGSGTLEMATGDRYEGQWAEGKKNGQGHYVFANGDVYEGQFENGNRQGQGTYTWTDESYYCGEWLGDKMNGKGVYANSEVQLEGYFENDNFIKPL